MPRHVTFIIGWAVCAPRRFAHGWCGLLQPNQPARLAFTRALEAGRYYGETVALVSSYLDRRDGSSQMHVPAGSPFVTFGRAVFLTERRRASAPRRPGMIVCSFLCEANALAGAYLSGQCNPNIPWSARPWIPPGASRLPVNLTHAFAFSFSQVPGK